MLSCSFFASASVSSFSFSNANHSQIGGNYFEVIQLYSRSHYLLWYAFLPSLFGNLGCLLLLLQHYYFVPGLDCYFYFLVKPKLQRRKMSIIPVDHVDLLTDWIQSKTRSSPRASYDLKRKGGSIIFPHCWESWIFQNTAHKVIDRHHLSSMLPQDCLF